MLHNLRNIHQINGNVKEQRVLSLFKETGTKLFLKEPVFPSTFSQLISVGEQTGNLDEMFNSVSSYYEEEFDTAVANLSSLIEPIICILKFWLILRPFVFIIHVNSFIIIFCPKHVSIIFYQLTNGSVVYFCWWVCTKSIIKYLWICLFANINVVH